MGLSLPHLIVLALVVLLLFGRGKISELMGDFGKGIKSFKEGINDEAHHAPAAPAQIAAQPAAMPAPVLPTAATPAAPHPEVLPHGAPAAAAPTLSGEPLSRQQAGQTRA